MINLIPKEEKKKMTMGFYYRLLVLFFVMMDFCVLVLSVSVVPSYVLSSIKIISSDTKLKNQKNEPLPLVGEQSLLAIKGINSKLDSIESSEKKKFLISQKVINPIILKKRSDIKITQIFYEDGPIYGKKINISGTAPSREVLLLFRQSLEDSPSFKNVDLPISNFIKGSDIQFSLTLTPS